MAGIRNLAEQFCKDESGEIKIQYVVVVALITVFCIYGIKYLGSAANNQHSATSNMLQNASTPSGS